jgi:lysyl-tRNA synthetase class 2
LDFEPLDQYQQRRRNLTDIQALGHPAYPHKFDWTHTPSEILKRHGESTVEQLESSPVTVTVAGRIVALRPHGKAAFAHIAGDGARVQIYIRQDVVGEDAYKLFKLMDLGDFIGITGHLFRTKTNELSVKVEKLELLTKALLPLPEKWHGLADVELRYRRRYLDLIVNEKAREVFIRRAKIIREIRHFFDARNYSEVETPMMHPILGGATARPFITHHNTLDMKLYLRIAPELYLKRLVVGGLDRVYEINRNFRNEGIDAIHLQEFTMLEFYQAYSDYRELMDMTEELFRGLAEKICGGTKFKYEEIEIDFGNFERLSMRDAIVKFWPTAAGLAPTNPELVASGGPLATAERLNIYLRAQNLDPIVSPEKLSGGELTGELFEVVAEPHLIQPTFIYDFPIEISPLSKSKADDPSIAERFELFIANMEVANGFSELNDPIDQENRFRAQVEKGGHEAPKEVDVDYIRALSHGLPPTAGEGIGIDRLVMLLTDSRSIREVVLFPLLRAESGDDPAEEPPTPAADATTKPGADAAKK